MKYESKKPRVIVPEGGSGFRDGVAQYISLLVEALLAEGVETEIFQTDGRLGKWVQLLTRTSTHVLVQYPQESWGHSVSPTFWFVLASLMRKKVILVLHEYRGMHFLRRWSIVPLILVASKLVFVAKSVQDDFDRSRLGRILSRTYFIPIGSNITYHEISDQDVLRLRSSSEKHSMDELIVGFFGFIYPAKNLDLLLRAVAAIRRDGRAIKIRLVGGFPTDHHKQEEIFWGKVKSYGIEDVIEYLGFVESDLRVAELMKACNVLYLFYEDGLSERRSSFWFAYQLGVRIITNRGVGTPDVERLITNFNFDGSVDFLEMNPSEKEVVEKILDCENYSIVRSKPKSAPLWRHVAQRYHELLVC